MSAFLCYSMMPNSKDREVTTNIHGHREHAIYGVQLYIPTKDGRPAVYDNMDEPAGPYAE